MDEGRVDRELTAVLDELIGAIQEAKQAIWGGPSRPVHDALEDLRSFLGDQIVAVADAEAVLGGRSGSLLTPTGHQLGNLQADAHDDPDAAVSMFLDDVRAVASDIRRRAGELDGVLAEQLRELAGGIVARVDRVAAAQNS